MNVEELRKLRSKRFASKKKRLLNKRKSIINGAKKQNIQH
jgi:hypothetical protein